MIVKQENIRDDALPEFPQEAKLVLAGLSGWGKSMALHRIDYASQVGSHGYPVDSIEHVELIDHGHATLLDDYAEVHSENWSGTDDFNTWRYRLRVSDPMVEGTRTCNFECVDFKGEIMLEYGSDSSAMPSEDRQKLEKHLDGAAGIVVMLPATDIADTELTKHLMAFLDFVIKRKRSKGGLLQLKRIVIALTKIDLHLASIADLAFDVASDPESMARVASILLKSRSRYFDRLEREFRSIGIEERVICMSNHGFCNGFGSANIRLSDAGSDPRRVQGMTSQNYIPYLVGDPFFYAATGWENPFHNSISALRAM
ncbi:hypothetical protein [Puniceibacterium sediminis]|uniref:Uncharacterized protein n=1 Tax=Puniceibacterium sediminis TaxID=1608407 RepID=A0A238YWE8_9RHOB|nr:hypothetical protein [Puniceibacterium sediminis]SNR74954.1 hypothetical protein SAMN06265370_12042 [Puniceibacterium sediminis]